VATCPKELRGATMLSDLMMRPGGSEYWKRMAIEFKHALTLTRARVACVSSTATWRQQARVPAIENYIRAQSERARGLPMSNQKSKRTGLRRSVGR